jgi:pantetheine-phosphate adenylyltransferase
MAAWIADEKVIVRVTGPFSARHEETQLSRCADDALLTKKENRDMLESLPERIQGVRRFMELFKPSLFYDIVPIKDVYGPVATDSNIQALVVSKETTSGGKAGTSFYGSPCSASQCAHILVFKWTGAERRRGCHH